MFFASFCVLILFLLLGNTPFRAVTLSLGIILVVSGFSKHTRVGIRELLEATAKAAHGGVSLIAAASCVGLILGVVLLTGIGTKLPGMLVPLAQNNLILALLLLMVSTIVLGMGLPSSVCYLLMATLVGSILTDLGLVPLAAHLFIFYFGMMSMVTPPVALAAYTAGAIANANIMRTGFAGFPICVGWFRAAVRVRAAPGIIDSIFRRWSGGILVDCGEPGNYRAWNRAVGGECGRLFLGALSSMESIGTLCCCDGVHSRSLRDLAAPTGLNLRASNWVLELALKHVDG